MCVFNCTVSALETEQLKEIYRMETCFLSFCLPVAYLSQFLIDRMALRDVFIRY